ncbi:MAG: sensor histidine kinase [Opitutaceae bacterium]
MYCRIIDRSIYRASKAKRIACAFLTLLCASYLYAIEGIDVETGGSWRDASVKKPWSYNGQNVYGTAGYYLFNVTEPGGTRAANRPADEGLKVSLPAYIETVTPIEGGYTAHSFDYLLIDSPDGQGQVESGLFAVAPEMAQQPVDIIQIKLGAIPKLYGFRLGILIANAERTNLSPAEITLRRADNSWNRSITNLPQSKDGVWVFFTVPAKHAGKTLILSVKSRERSPVTIGGLIFDDLTVAPEAFALGVTTNDPVTRNGNVTWISQVDPVKNGDDSESTEPWEHKLAMSLMNTYRQNTERLEVIADEINQLPTPYTGEPTGTGGYMTKWIESRNNEIKIHFNWDEEVDIDAVALFPLRLFLADENGLTDNAYWPGDITIQSVHQDERHLLARLVNTQDTIKQSLPEFVSFEPIKTYHLEFTITDLSKRIGNNQYAAGFSEIGIFSKQENITPRAKLRTSNSREGYRIYSREYLIDGQTPLGLPEIGPRTSGSLGLTIRQPNRVPKKPINIVLNLTEKTKIDEVRLDPAIIYKPGQAFPVRFSVELLDEKKQVLQSDDRFKDKPLRNLGLNPYTSIFTEVEATHVRIRIYEVSMPNIQSTPWIQISEITPMFDGIPIKTVKDITSPMNKKSQRAVGITDPSGLQLYWSAKSAHDGHTQSGKLLTLRDWVEGLHKRQQLLEEQLELENANIGAQNSIRTRSLWAVTITFLMVLIGSIYIIIHYKVKARRELRNARERIASDLHDDVGSNLGTITLHAEYLLDHVEETGLQERLKAIFKLAYESTYGLREVLHTSAPRIGRAQNILGFMQELAAIVLPDTEKHIELDQSIRGMLTNPEVRKGLLLYYKEAITNIQSHAQCSNVFISMKRTDYGIELIIKDDGIGMSQDITSKDITLRTLKLRAKELGSLEIHSKEGEGTELILRVSV